MHVDDLPVRLNRAGKHRCGPAWRLSPKQTRRWPDLDLWFLVAGRGFVQTPEGELNLEPGCCLLMRGGEDYHFHPSQTQPFIHYWVHFDYLGADGEPLNHRELSLPPRFRRVRSLRPLTDMFDRLVETSRAPAPWHAGRAEQWLTAILMEVARADTVAGPGVECAPHHAAIEAMRDRILTDPGADHRVEALAQELDLTPSYFCRLFRRYIGLAPRQFITSARMDTARYLLRDTALSAGDIATTLGYYDVHFFSRHFRCQHGMSPTTYRRSGRPRD